MRVARSEWFAQRAQSLHLSPLPLAMERGESKHHGTHDQLNITVLPLNSL